jgi:hypothetical protein
MMASKQIQRTGRKALVYCKEDFDGYEGPRSFKEALNNKRQPLGNSFVLKALLEEPEYISELLRVHKENK